MTYKGLLQWLYRTKLFIIYRVCLHLFKAYLAIHCHFEVLWYGFLVAPSKG